MIGAALALAIVAQANPKMTETRLENALAIEQTLDIVTSQLIFAKPGTFEEDPLASKNVTTEILEAAGIQGALRLTKPSQGKTEALRLTVYVYPLVTLHNLRILVRIK